MMLPWGVQVVISPWLPEESVRIVDGKVVAGSQWAVIAELRRELRRMDAVAAFAPGLITPETGK